MFEVCILIELRNYIEISAKWHGRWYGVRDENAELPGVSVETHNTHTYTIAIIYTCVCTWCCARDNPESALSSGSLLQIREFTAQLFRLSSPEPSLPRSWYSHIGLFAPYRDLCTRNTTECTIVSFSSLALVTYRSKRRVESVSVRVTVSSNFKEAIFKRFSQWDYYTKKIYSK